MRAALDAGVRGWGREQMAIYGEQRVEEGWKRELERKAAARLGRALTTGGAVTSGRHLSVGLVRAPPAERECSSEPGVRGN